MREVRRDEIEELKNMLILCISMICMVFSPTVGFSDLFFWDHIRIVFFTFFMIVEEPT